MVQDVGGFLKRYWGRGYGLMFTKSVGKDFDLKYSSTVRDMRLVNMGALFSRAKEWIFLSPGGGGIIFRPEKWTPVCYSAFEGIPAPIVVSMLS